MFEFIQSIPPAVFEAVGVLGFTLYVLNYALLTFHKVTSRSSTYFCLNLIAASLVLIGLTHSFNLASAMIQMFWIVMSLAAIGIRIRDRSHARPPRRPLAQTSRP